ncbi:MAG: transpeptidase family protein [Prevotella sp.]|nr:transpeptidase family protein [Prevotella sp.]
MRRFSIIAFALTILITMAIGQAGRMMTVERHTWDSLADLSKKDSVPIDAQRGDILSCNGDLMASSLPVYQLILDFRAMHEAKSDTLWEEKIDSICTGLHRIYPKYSVQHYRNRLDEGYKKRTTDTAIINGNPTEVKKRIAYWPIMRDRVTYNQLQEASKLPIFKLGRNKSGFYGDMIPARKKPYGTLASRTIGTVSGMTGNKSGLEASLDSILKGKDGIKNRRKVLNRYLDISIDEPINGKDVVTTLDLEIQDLSERALLKMMQERKAEHGCVIVMEVKTGDIKAIVNLDKDTMSVDAYGHHYWNGRYTELYNHAVADLLEPGSVFKTVSALVALDDGVIDTTTTVDTGRGVWTMYNSRMRDWGWSTIGGFGVITLNKAMQQSSNIGISRLIDEKYKDNAEKYVQGVYRTGIHDTLNIPLSDAKNPRIRMPKRLPNGKYDRAVWYPTALPWMSIGYETQIPPISTLTFYNAIANNGKMMRPRLVKAIMEDGKVVKEFAPEVMREHICRHHEALEKVQIMLEQVVTMGTAKKTVKSNLFRIAGKTGTAQIADGARGYKSGGVVYLASFAGYFPADNPQYSAIVCIKTRSGGGSNVGGPVFKEVAEGIMARNVKYDAKDAYDQTARLVPDVKQGNISAAGHVLNSIGIATTAEWDNSSSAEPAVWGYAETRKKRNIVLHQSEQENLKHVPDVRGMGARDAVYLLESRGLKVTLTGRGKVIGQSIPAGQAVKKGESISLMLHI